MSRHGITAALCGLVIALTGCALLPTPLPEPKAWAQRQKELAGIDHFSLRGRISTNAATAPGANLYWRQDGASFDVRISGPFGAGAVSIQGTPDDVELRNGQEIVRTSQPEAWLRKRVGWSLPVRGLRYWIVGLPAPGSHENIAWDERGRLALLVQSGWTLNFEEYSLVEQWELPRLLVLQRGDLRVKFVIDEWPDLPALASPASL